MENKNKKCSFKSHQEINAILFCQNCKYIYICNKCEKIHSEWFSNHNIYNLDKDPSEIFTGFCTEKKSFL